MKKQMLVKMALLVSALLGAQVASAGSVECKMSFNISGWSLIYKHSSGTGEVRCTDGTRMSVKITTNGGGLTAGKSKIEGGIGKFSGISSINEIPGVYAQADASAGAVKSGTAQVLTKGSVSLALSGSGQGFDLGVSIGGMSISKVK
jgi:hypothetical protein